MGLGDVAEEMQFLSFTNEYSVWVYFGNNRMRFSRHRNRIVFDGIHDFLRHPLEVYGADFAMRSLSCQMIQNRMIYLMGNCQIQCLMASYYHKLKSTGGYLRMGGGGVVL